MRYIKNNAMLIFATIIYGFLIFTKHEKAPSRLMIYRADENVLYLFSMILFVKP